MILIKNKKANFDYEFSKTFEAGIVLSGQEVKSLRLKHGSLTGSYVKAIGEELFLLNTQINLYKYSNDQDYDPKRTRKLLVKKKEIYQLMEAGNKKGWNIIPLSLNLQRGKIKVMIGLGRGKKQFEKREILKNKAIKRDLEKEVKQKYLR